MNKITIKDLAKMLSLSVSTISRALSDHPDISEETKQRVKSTADKYNYLPNLHARFFRKKNTKMIALILPEFNRFFIPDIISGIQQVIDKNGYSLIIFQSRNNYLAESEILKYCISWVVEGVLISLSENTNNLDHLKILKDNDIPVVILDKVLRTNEHSTVTIDDKQAAYQATKAILSSGRKNILGIFGHENLSITQERMLGFDAAISDSKLTKIHKNKITINGFHHLKEQLQHIASQHQYDGIFFMTDELLVHGLNHFLKSEIMVPNELGIVAISDGTSPYFLFPNISHIFHSGYQVGSTASNLLFNLITDRNMKVQHKIVGTNFIDLGSQ